MAKTPTYNIIINGKRLANCTKVSGKFKHDNQTDVSFDGIKKSQSPDADITVTCSNYIDKNTQDKIMIKDAIEQAQSKEGLVITIENLRTGVTKHFTGCVVDSYGFDDDPKKLNTDQEFQFSATDWEEDET
jgi:hypothetical protein